MTVRPSTNLPPAKSNKLTCFIVVVYVWLELVSLLLFSARSMMRHKGQAMLLAVLGLLLSGAPAFAHHSFSSEFDGDKETKIKGVITKVDWINPHAYWHIDV